MNLTEFFTPAAIAAYMGEVGSNMIPYLGASLFPARKKAGLDLSWLKGSKGLPVSLMPSTFDAKATYRDRISIEKMKAEMPFFREGYKIKEKDRQEILRAQDTNDPYLAQMIASVFDDANDLIAGANVVPERMIWQLLCSDKGDAGIAIKANGVDYSYKYDTDGSWKTTNYIGLTSQDAWTETTTADPFKNFKAAKDAVRNKTGAELTTAVMNGNTFNMLAATDAVKNRYLSVSGLKLGYLSDNEVISAVQGTSGINIIVYDKQYRDESKKTAKFIPDGFVVLLPDGPIGTTWYGTTPEEADLMGSNVAEVSIVNTGVAITREIIPHPVNVNIFASEIVLPSFERMDDVVTMKVVGE